MELEDIVSKYPPKQIMLIPIAIIVLALISLGVTYLSTGSPVKLGIEFTGGTLVTVPATESEDAVATQFAGVSSGRYKEHWQQIYAPIWPYERIGLFRSGQGRQTRSTRMLRSGIWDPYTARSFRRRSSSIFLFLFY